MGKLGNILVLIAVLVLVAVLAFSALFERIAPATIGVRQNQIGGSGIAEEDFMPGFHLGIAGVHKWHHLDRRTHFLAFSERAQGGRRFSENDQGPMEVRTKDNNSISADVTVTYRIIPGEGHLIVSEGKKSTYRDRVASSVKSVLRSQLAQLTPEDFVITDRRLSLAEASKTPLRSELAQYHVEPLEVLIRAVRFPDDFERKLQEKQLTTQLAHLAQSQQAVEEKAGETGEYEAATEAGVKTKVADWDRQLEEIRKGVEAEIQTILGEAKKQERVLRSEADRSYTIAVADGDLAMDKAEATRFELRTAALANEGGTLLMAMQAAENLTFESVTLNSNDPSIPSIIDVSAMVKLLTGR